MSEAGRIRVLFMQSRPFFGADTAIESQLMRYLQPMGVDVHAAVTTEAPAAGQVSTLGEVSKLPGVHVRPTSFGPSMYGSSGLARLRRLLSGASVPLNFARLAQYARRNRINVVHAKDKPRDAFYGVLLGRAAGARVIVHAHTAYGDWMSPLLKWALGQADAIVAVSDFAARSYLEAGYRSDRVRVVHNALDISGWDPSIDAAPVRAELGIKPDELVVGIVGRMYRWKGHGDLLNAVAMVSQNVPGVKVLVVGQDDVLLNEGRSYKADLEEQARRLGISSRVVFAGFRKDVDRLVAAMDVFALPSWGDSFGMVYLEAMAMNKPCVAWTAGGAPEVIETGRTGYVVPTGDVAALAKALDALLVSPELRQRFGEEGRRRAETVFTPQRMSESMLSVYRSVLGRTQTSSATGRAALA